MNYTPTIWENGKKPAINATHLNKIENELAKLDNIVSMPDITITDQTTMPNSHDGRLLVEEIGGVCEQNTTSGKNLLEISEYNTNASGNTSKYMNAPKLQVGETYILSGKTLDGIALSGNNTQMFFLNSSNTKILNGTMEWFTKGFVAPSILSEATRIEVFTGDALANKTVQIQLEAGSVVTAYEPYTGGIPSPNPSYPQEIKKTVVSEIRTHGKNLFDVSKFKTNQYISGDGSVSANGAWGTSDYMMAKVPSVTFSHKDSVWLQLVIAEYDSKKNFIRTTVKQGFLPTVTQELSENTSYIRISYSIDVGNGVFEREEVMINEGTTALPYEPYTESVVTLSQPIELYGIGDVQDVIEDGKVIRNVATRRLTGTEDVFAVSSTYKGSFYFSCIAIGGKPQVSYLCTHAIHKGNYATNFVYGTCISNAESYNLWLFEEQKTVAEIQEYLANNEVYIAYQLITPTTEALPIADQIALNSLATYDGITYLEFDSEIEPTFKGEYGTSKVGGYTLEALLTARSK